MGTLDNTGYLTKSFATNKSELQQLFQTAFGSDVDLSDESPQGVWVNNMAEWLSNQDAIGLDVYNNMSLNLAEGLQLDYIAVLRGTFRRVGTKAIITATMTSTVQPYSIPALTQYRLIGSDFACQNDAQVDIIGLTQSEQLTAVNVGLSGVVVGDKLQSIGYISTLSDITVTAVTEGTDAETDDELRIRLEAINSISSVSDIDAIYSGLLNLSNVTKVSVLENAASTTDAVNGIPPYGIKCYVLGDTDQNISDVIFAKRPAGTPTTGTTSATSLDIQGVGHVIKFSRPSKVNVYIACTATAKDNQTSVDTSFNDIIRVACSGYVAGLAIGQDVSYTTIFGEFAKHNAFDIVSLKMSTAGTSTGMAASSITMPASSYGDISVPATSIVFSVV